MMRNEIDLEGSYMQSHPLASEFYSGLSPNSLLDKFEQIFYFLGFEEPSALSTPNCVCSTSPAPLSSNEQQLEELYAIRTESCSYEGGCYRRERTSYLVGSREVQDFVINPLLFNYRNRH